MVSESWGGNVHKVGPFGMIWAMIKASKTRCQCNVFAREKCILRRPNESRSRAALYANDTNAPFDPYAPIHPRKTLNDFKATLGKRKMSMKDPDDFFCALVSKAASSSSDTTSAGTDFLFDAHIFSRTLDMRIIDRSIDQPINRSTET